MGYKRELEVASETLRKLHKRGVRVLPGGDYGFARMPHGTNANDLQYFVDYIGMSPKEALLAATKLGGETMMRGHELGQVRPGYLADIVLIDGDPLANLKILTEPSRIAMVMKDGVIHKHLQEKGPDSGGLHLSTAESPIVDQGVKEAAPA